MLKRSATARFERDFASAPRSVQQAFDKQVALLIENIRHPSLRAKRYDEETGLWQVRVTKNWRAYFIIRGDICLFVRMEKHKD